MKTWIKKLSLISFAKASILDKSLQLILQPSDLFFLHAQRKTAPSASGTTKLLHVKWPESISSWKTCQSEKLPNHWSLSPCIHRATTWLLPSSIRFGFIIFWTMNSNITKTSISDTVNWWGSVKVVTYLPVLMKTKFLFIMLILSSS